MIIHTDKFKNNGMHVNCQINSEKKSKIVNSDYWKTKIIM